jgi:hypothetical protein
MRCALTDAVRGIVKRTPNVRGFLGGETPIAISDQDAEMYLCEVYGRGPSGPLGLTMKRR